MSKEPASIADLIAFVRSHRDAPSQLLFWLTHVRTDGVGEASFRRAWLECPRADWLIWIADELEVGPRLVAAAIVAAGRARDLPGRPQLDDDDRSYLPTPESDAAIAVRKAIMVEHVLAALYSKRPRVEPSGPRPPPAPPSWSAPNGRARA